MCEILFRLIFAILSFVGTFMSVFMVMISALLNLNEAGPIDPVGNSLLIICMVVASFFISVSRYAKYSFLYFSLSDSDNSSNFLLDCFSAQVWN
mgnify:CR=1 FL=1